MGKKEKTTKLISVMVSATLATGMVPAAAFAQEAIEAGSLNEDTPSLLSGDEISPSSQQSSQWAISGGIEWSIDGGVLTVKASDDPEAGSDVGAMPDYGPGKSPWYGQRSSVTKVVIENDVLGVGANAFRDCSNCEDAQIGEGVESIGDWAFRNTKLSSIAIPGNVKTLGSYIFQLTNTLTSVAVGEGAETISPYCFQQAAGLVSLSLPKSVVTIGDAPLRQCRSLETVTFGGETTSGNGKYEAKDGMLIEAAGAESALLAVYGSTYSGTELHVPEGVGRVGGYLLEGNQAVKRLILPTSVTQIGQGALSSCAVESVEVAAGNAAFSSENDVLYATGSSSLVFYPANKSDKAFSIPSGVKTIENGAFNANKHLESLKTDAELESMGSSALNGCSSLKEISLNDGLQEIGSDAFGKTALESVVLPDSVSSVGARAFYNDQLSYLHVGTGLRAVGPNAFQFKNEGVDSVLVDLTGLPSDAELSEGSFATGTGGGTNGFHQIYVANGDMLAKVKGAVSGSNACYVVANGGSVSAAAPAGGADAADLAREGYSGFEYRIGGLAASPAHASHSVGDAVSAFCSGGCITEIDAAWKYSISFDANGGSGNAPEQEVVEGDTLTKLNANSFEGPEGKSFRWWNTKADGTGVSYAEDSIASSVSPGTTLYAIWSEGDVAASGTCGATSEDNLTWTLTQNNNGEDAPTYTLSIYGEGAMADFGYAPKASDDKKAPWYRSLESSLAEGETVVPISEIDIQGDVSYIGDYAFACTDVRAATFSSSTTNYGDVVYGYCPSLKKVVWDGFNPVDVKDGWVTAREDSGAFIPFGLFDQDPSLDTCVLDGATYPAGELVVPGNVDAICTAAFRGTAFSTVDFNEGLKGIKAVGPYCFGSMANLKSVTIPSGVEFYNQRKAGATQDSPANTFNGSGLESVTFSDGVAAIPSGMCSGCKNLSSVIIEGALEKIGGSAFSKCKSLKQFDFPDSLKEIGGYAFEGSGLTSIDIGAVESIARYAFFGTQYLTDVKIVGSDTVSLDASVFGTYTSYDPAAPIRSFELQNGSIEAFYASVAKTTLETLVLGDGVKSVPNGLCNGFEKLSTVELGDGVKTIGSNAFSGTAISGISVPDSVQSIGASAFSSCKKLEAVEFGAGSELTSIGGSAFFSCPIKSIALPSKVSSIGSQAFFINADLGIDFRMTYDMTGIGSQPEVGPWAFTAWWQNQPYQINRAFYVSNSDLVDYLKGRAPTSSSTAPRTQNAIFAVTNGGTFDGDPGVVSGTLATPSRAGYRFAGWFTKDGSNGDWGEAVTSLSNGTYFAKWEPVYTVELADASATFAYTGDPIEPVISVKYGDSDVSPENYTIEYSKNVNAGTATATVKVGDTVIGTASFSILKATPEISITPSSETLWGGGTVTLAVSGAPDEGELSVSCDDSSVPVRKDEKGEYTAFLPNATKDYTFTASYAPKGNVNYEQGYATATVHVDYYDPSYPVNIDNSAISGGSVTVSPKNAVPGQKVTLAPKADAGHVLGDLAVKDSKGNELELVDNGDGTFSFKMPSGKVTVEAEFPVMTFPDVDYSQWYAPGVEFMAGKGLMTGYSDTGLFGVGKTLTRGELATILWRNACPDEAAAYDPAAAKDTTGIAGSADGQFYTAAANWAVANKVITGIVREDGSLDFAADEDVTFEQLVTILARVGATPDEVAAAGSDLSSFLDGSDASVWSAPSLKWAADEGLVEGYDTEAGKLLAPGEDVARERVATVLMRAFDLGILK